MVWVLSLKQKFFGLYWYFFFWGWNIKERFTTRHYSWSALFSIICKWPSPIIIWVILAPFCVQMYFYFKKHGDVKKIVNVLRQDFSSLCQWFIDNKLSIHFGEDKTKSIFFLIAKGSRKIDISFAIHSIKQHKTVDYLGCQLDSKLSWITMASKVLKNTSVKLKFLPRKSKYLTLTYRKLLSHFD